MSTSADETDDFAPITAASAAPGAPPSRHGTGLLALDAVTGGLAPGVLWMITGAPGQGRSTFVTQIAQHQACENGLPTYLVSNRDPAKAVAARLHASRTRIPLSHLLQRRLTPSDEERLVRDVQELQSSPLRIATGSFARQRTSKHLRRMARQRPLIAAFDDPEWETQWDLHEARALADIGAAVVVTLPLERLLSPVAKWSELTPTAGLADVILGVRHERISDSGDLAPEGEPGRATLTLLRNRLGPTNAIPVGFFAHQARFFDIDT